MPRAEERVSVPVVATTPAEFRRGLERLGPELRCRALRLTKDPVLADDVMQDALVRALTFESQYRTGTNLRAWAYQILFSVFVTRYRRSRREKNALRHLSTDMGAWTHNDAFGSPEDHAPLTKATSARLSALPAGFRAVIEKVDLGDSTYREAACELGLPLGTVMSRLHRGRRMLAESLTTLEARATTETAVAA